MTASHLCVGVLSQKLHTYDSTYHHQAFTVKSIGSHTIQGDILGTKLNVLGLSLSTTVFLISARSQVLSMIVRLITFSHGVVYSYVCTASPTESDFHSQKLYINLIISFCSDQDWDPSTVIELGT